MSAKIEVVEDNVSPAPRKKATPAGTTVGTIYTAYEALVSLGNEKLDPTSSARIVKLAGWMEPIYEDVVELKKREATRLGNPIEEGKVQIPPERLTEFTTIMNAELVKPVTVPDRIKITLEELAGAKVSPATILHLRCVLRDNLD